MMIGPEDVERSPVQNVGLEVEHREPDPHRRQDLDQGQAPVGEDELHSLEEHLEGPHGQRKGCEPAARAAHAQYRRLHHRFVAVADGLDQLAQAAHRSEFAEAAHRSDRGHPLDAGANPPGLSTRARLHALAVGSWSPPLALRVCDGLRDVLGQRRDARMPERLLDERAHDRHVLGVGGSV